MFSFFRRSAPRPVSEAISQAIQSQGLTPPLGDPAQLRMVQSRGRYSDRQVTFFRIFDPTVTAQRSLDIQRYRDLDAFQDLILRAGHVERDGNVVIIRPPGTRIADVTARTRAGRTVPPVPTEATVGTEASAADDPATVNATSFTATS